MAAHLHDGATRAVLGFFFQAEDGIRGGHVTGVQTCALPISSPPAPRRRTPPPAAPGRGRSRPCRSEERRVGKESRSRWPSPRKKEEAYSWISNAGRALESLSDVMRCAAGSERRGECGAQPAS